MLDTHNYARVWHSPRILYNIVDDEANYYNCTTLKMIAIANVRGGHSTLFSPCHMYQGVIQCCFAWEMINASTSDSEYVLGLRVVRLMYNALHFP